MLTLYTSTLSANGRKTLAVTRHLDLNVHIEEVNVYAGEGNTDSYRAVNPWGKIPTLVDNDFTLWESNAILVYLSEFHGNNSLYSADKYIKSDILKWLFWESSHWQPTLNRVLAPRVGQVLFDRNNSEVAEANWKDSELVSLLDYLESQLSTKPFINGDFLTIADYSIAGMTTYFEACKFPKNTYPSVQSWIERMDGITSWKSTLNALWSTWSSNSL